MNYEELLIQQVLSDDRYIILTAENRAAIRNLPGIIPDRFIDTGITEQTLVGVSAGLALRGRIPVSHALASFLTMRAFEFIRTDVGIPKLPVKLVGSFAGFLSEANGPTHQAVEDISLMRGIPKMNVFCPADENDMLKCLPKILGCNKPFYIRYNNSKPFMEHQNFVLGKAEQIGDGKDVAILTYGVLTEQAVKAAEILRNRGVSARVLNMRCLKPLDKEAVDLAISETSLLVTVEDHFLTGGLFTILSEHIVKNNQTAKVYPVALKNKWFKPALFNDVLEYEGFTASQLANKIENHLIKKRTEYYVEWSCV